MGKPSTTQRHRKQSSSYYIGEFLFFPGQGTLRALTPTSILLRLDFGRVRRNLKTRRNDKNQQEKIRGIFKNNHFNRKEQTKGVIFFFSSIRCYLKTYNLVRT